MGRVFTPSDALLIVLALSTGITIGLAIENPLWRKWVRIIALIVNLLALAFELGMIYGR